MRKRWFISLIIGIIITGGCLGYLHFEEIWMCMVPMQ